MKIDMNQERHISDLDLNSPIVAQKKPLNRFIVASVLVHAMVATAVIVHKQNQHDVPENNEVSLQVDVGTPSEDMMAPEAAPHAEVAAEQVGTDSQIETTAEPTPNQNPIVAKAVQDESQEQEIVATVVKQPEIKTKVIKAQSIPVQTEPTDEGIEAKSETETQNVTTETQTEKNGESPAPVAALISPPVDQVESELEAEASQVEKELEETSQKQLEEIKKQKEQAQALAAARIAKMKEEQSALAAAEAAAAEKAQAEQAAQRAAEEAAARAAAEQAAAAQASQSADLAENQNGLGSGSKNAGPGEAGAEVRSLEQLRQMPGNPKPAYDAEERFKGHQGIVVFQAFVTTEGRLQDFQMLQSSGHRNLDAKTLKALKQWKFYPGQAGWVELPFNWNLKGGPQEMPALLRRRIGKGPQKTEGKN